MSEGTLLDVSGRLITGDAVALGTGGKIRCLDNISIGAGTDITEECQVLDTDFHLIQNSDTGDIRRPTDKINIGAFCWIGNRTTITKGSVLPDYSIVASNSLVNRDFSKLKDVAPLIGGIPAKQIGRGMHRIYDKKLEWSLFAKFLSTPDLKSIHLSPIPFSVVDDLKYRNQL